MITNGKAGKVVIGGEMVNGEIVGGEPIAEINSWHIDAAEPPEVPTTYEYTGIFKISWWQRLKMKRSLRRMFPPHKRSVKVTFICDGPVGVHRSTK